jgi:adenylyltransferase/sulfurtransferase
MTPPPELSPADLARYGRHLSLAEIGVEGQRKLAAARILVVGAGGLGSPAALYLAAAGVGTLGIADFDRVERHNLQRQLLHEDRDVGAPKVESALRRLRAVNPGIRLNAHPEGVQPGTALNLFSNYDVIVDGTDTFASRYLNNDAAVLTERPLVHGNVFRFDGQLSVFDPARGGPCYRCLFPQPPPAGAVPSCGEAGVLGALCGVIGSLQALEAIKLVTGAGEPLRGRLLAHDALAQRFQILSLARDPDCAVCGQAPVIRSLELERYATACALPSPPPFMSESFPLEVSVTAARDLVRQDPAHTRIIDVREPHELEICRLDGAEHIPMRRIPERLAELSRDQHLLILCHHGSRSLQVTRYLRQQGFTTVTNVAGGIDAWAAELDPSLARY